METKAPPGVGGGGGRKQDPQVQDSGKAPRFTDNSRALLCMDGRMILYPARNVNIGITYRGLGCKKSELRLLENTQGEGGGGVI